jgi:DsbC/DsbD-like thiol-disulfide interchange protein
VKVAACAWQLALTASSCCVVNLLVLLTTCDDICVGGEASLWLSTQTVTSKLNLHSSNPAAFLQ